MTDFSNVEFLGPGAEAARERQRQALESRAQQAARQQAAVEAFINGTGPDPETGTAVSGPKASDGANAPALTSRPGPAKSAADLERLIRQTRARIRRLKRRKP